jgi:TatD DNase family protein
MEEFDAVHGLATAHSNFWCSVGVHPDNEGVSEPSIEALCALAGKEKVVAIGETGLDYYRLNGRSVSDMEWQRQRFRTHIRAAQRSNKPLVVHTRSASNDTLSILKEEGEGLGNSGRAGGVFHCFTESLDVARDVLDLGYYISFSGIVTFNSAKALRDVVAFVPLDRMLIETDSPYLAPTPYRGKTNDPSLVPFVAKQVSTTKGLAIEVVAETTSRNFDSLFHPL